MQDKPSDSAKPLGDPVPAGHERVVYVMPTGHLPGEAGDEIDLVATWKVLWERRWLIGSVTVLFALAGVIYSLLATEWYRAEVLLAPAEEKTVTGLAGQLGGIASLAGISVGGGGNVEPVAILKSQGFVREFIEDQALMRVLMADEWDAVTDQWKSSDPKDWPDIRDAVKYFDESVRKVSEDRKTGLVTLSISWTDPVVAAEWADLLVKKVNDRMRQRALTEAERNLRYLREEMAATNVVSLQQSIGRLLESEMQKLMLARGNEEFAFRVIDPASPPKLRYKPKRKVTVALAVLLGGMLAVLGVLVQHAAAGERRQAAG